MQFAGMWVGPLEDPDRYHLADLCSQGGEGSLWRASVMVGRTSLPIALKIAHEHHADQQSRWSEQWRAQAELLRSLEHPGLVRVRECFEGPPPHPRAKRIKGASRLYLAMNWMAGISLRDWILENSHVDFATRLRVIEKVALAVDYLHDGAQTSSPVLHRDIKPANVMIQGDDVRLVDFGLALIMDDSTESLAGTLGYMAPEVMAGGSYSPAADRYALGATTYFALTGREL